MTMSQTPNYDAKVKLILDVLTPGERTCSLTGEKWMMTDEEIGWYKAFNVPPSTVSPQTRWKYHGLWYVGYQYWYQAHPVTGKPIVCTVHPSTGIKVLPDVEWFQKDFFDAGRDYDAAKSFFEQWRVLQLAVPMPASRNHVEPVNSIAFVSQGDEDSYFVGASKTKRTLYAHAATDVEDSAEVYESSKLQNCYNVVDSSRLHLCLFARASYDCINSAFLFDCRNCEFCFGVTNKRNKKYVWFNEQLTKDEWEKRRAAVDLGSRNVVTEYLQKFNDLVKDQAIWPENFNDHAVESNGEYLFKTTRVKDSYLCGEGAVDQYSCNFSIGNSEHDAFSGYAVNGSDFYYSASGGGRGQKFCFLTIRSDNMEYCLLCYNSRDCFGCVGLQRKQFCIFNKQYTEEEYWKRVDELKCAMLERGEYGEFFPAGYSPSYWADSGAPSWFGATEADVRAMGSMMYEPESNGAIGNDLVDPSRLKPSMDVPDHIDQLTDDWAGVPLLDAACGRRFSYIKPEVAFYRRLKIAPPINHFTSRIKALWKEANQGVFDRTTCSKCGKSLTVARNAAHPVRIIYCIDDYLKYLEING